MSVQKTNAPDASSERSYIAFISYRHKPLDMEVAKRLHRRIERFIVPAALRKDGRKKLGLVFRDQDELPISSSLSANIQQALDRSEYLIVVCTPETPQSKWVAREIDYFLEHHDNDHVLAVLADGLPQTSFPPRLMENDTEPLAADLIADNDRARWRLFKVESLRILASLVGCPFDALFRREQRYRRRRNGIVLGTVALVAAAFIGMLLNRNAQISALLELSQTNESKALAALSLNAYDQGDYNGALRYALDALPDTHDPRPYVAQAEYALATELHPYDEHVLGMARSFDQETDIIQLLLADDAQLVATMDAYGTLRVVSAETGALVWERPFDAGTIMMQAADSLIVGNAQGISCYNEATGRELWRRSDVSALEFAACSDDGALGLHRDCRGAAQTLHVMDLGSGEDIATIALADAAPGLIWASAMSRDNGLAALLVVEDAPAGDSAEIVEGAAASSARLFIADLSSQQVWEGGDRMPFSAGATAYALRFTDDGDLVLACDALYSESSVALYSRGDDWRMRFRTAVETEKVAQMVNGTLTSFAQIDLLDCAMGKAAFCSKHELSMIDLATGELLWHQRLEGALEGACMYKNACLGLVLSNGSVCFCTDEGHLSYTQEVYSYQTGFPISLAHARGESYPQTAFVAVPAANAKRFVLLRFQHNAQAQPIAAMDGDIARMCLIGSPSGQMVAAIGISPVHTLERVLLIDVAQEGTWRDFALPEEGFADLGSLALTDTGVLVDTASGYAIDLTTQEACDASNAEDGGQLTDCGVIDPGQLPKGWCKTIATPDGCYFVAFGEAGGICIFDGKTGALRSSCECTVQGVHFAAEGCHYEARMADDGTTLLIFCDNAADEKSLCMAVNTQAWECVGEFERVGAYLPGLARVLLTPSLEGVYMSPWYSLEDLMAQAEAIAADGS